MSILFRWISKSPNYIRSFGAWHGLRLLFAVEREVPQKSTATKTYRVPGYARDICLRETVSDHAIFWQCIVQQQYASSAYAQHDRLMRAYQAAVDAGATPLIIDCGGNIGLSALYLATRFPAARVYVVEPDADNFAVLKRNVDGLGGRVVALQGGIWDEAKPLQIINPDSGSAAFQLAPSDEGSSGGLRAYTIDEICSLAGVAAPLIVKVDIEGAQVNLFRSHTDWVGNTHLIMLELDDWLMPWQGTSRPFFSCVSRYPFDYLISGETIFCFRDFSESA